MEELLLEALAVLDELDVVDEQHVALAVLAFEREGGLRADGVDEVVQEVLGRDVEHAHRRVVVLDVVADRVEQVGLAEPRRPVDEQRVVGLARRLCNGLGGGEGQAVGACRDERVEGETGVEPRGVGLVGLAGSVSDGHDRRDRLGREGGGLIAVARVSNHQLDPHVVAYDDRHGVFHELEVPVVDTVALEGVGRLEHQLVTSEIHRAKCPEGEGPDVLRDLLSQGFCALRPEFVNVGHVVLHRAVPRLSTTLSTDSADVPAPWGARMYTRTRGSARAILQQRFQVCHLATPTPHLLWSASPGPPRGSCDPPRWVPPARSSDNALPRRAVASERVGEASSGLARSRTGLPTARPPRSKVIARRPARPPSTLTPRAPLARATIGAVLDGDGWAAHARPIGDIREPGRMSAPRPGCRRRSPLHPVPRRKERTR